MQHYPDRSKRYVGIEIWIGSDSLSQSSNALQTADVHTQESNL